MVVAQFALVILWMAVSRAAYVEKAPVPVVMGTWNILSVSKCDIALNGFPNMEPEAFKKHNQVRCEGSGMGGFGNFGVFKAKKIYLARMVMNKGLTESNALNVNLSTCESEWVGGAVKALMTDNDMDILFLQEVDFHMYLALDKLEYEKVPLNGMTWKDLGKDLGAKLKKSLSSDTPAGDVPVVVYGTKRIESGSGLCYAPKSEVYPKLNGKVALCQFRHKSNGWLNVVGMHAPGDKGFNAAIAAEFYKLLHGGYWNVKGQIDAVLGDFNLATAAKAQEGLNKLDESVVLPASMNEDTVFRHVHKARKLFQLYQNYVQALKVPFDCSNPELDKFFQENPVNAKDTDKNAQEIKDLKQFCADWTTIRQITDPKHKIPKDSGKLAGAIWEIRKQNLADPKFADIMFKEKFDWRELPAALGTNPALALTEVARVLVEPDIKREDYVAYNSNTYDVGAVKTHGVIQVSDEEKTTTTEPMPKKAWPSDHLPITMTLAPKAGFIPKRQLEARTTDPMKKIQNFESQSDIAMKNKPSKEKAKAKSASIRRKLGGMAPTMRKLLKALKRVSQRMRKGERAA